MPDTPISDMERMIAAKLKTRRKLLGISEERMAFANAISIDEYHLIEGAQQRINPSLLHELAHLLNVPIGYFLGSGRST